LEVSIRTRVKRETFLVELPAHIEDVSIRTRVKRETDSKGSSIRRAEVSIRTRVKRETEETLPAQVALHEFRSAPA